MAHGFNAAVYSADQLPIDPHSETVWPVSVVFALKICGRIIPCAVVIGHCGHLLVNLIIEIEIRTGFAVF